MQIFYDIKNIFISFVFRNIEKQLTFIYFLTKLKVL